MIGIVLKNEKIDATATFGQKIDYNKSSIYIFIKAKWCKTLKQMHKSGRDTTILDIVKTRTSISLIIKNFKLHFSIPIMLFPISYSLTELMRRNSISLRVYVIGVKCGEYPQQYAKLMLH